MSQMIDLVMRINSVQKSLKSELSSRGKRPFNPVSEKIPETGVQNGKFRTVVGRSSDGRRTVVGRPSDGPTAVPGRRPSRFFPSGGLVSRVVCEIFAKFSKVFGSFWKLSEVYEVFGRVRMRSDVFELFMVEKKTETETK